MSPFLKNKINIARKGKYYKMIDIGEVVYLFAIFFIVIATIISSTFNPFIYFRF